MQMQSMLEQVHEEIAAHRAYLERRLQECEIYLSQFDKPTPDDVAVPNLDVEKWPGRVAMMREMRDVLRGQLGIDPDSLEIMCHRLADAGGQKQRKIAQGRAIMRRALRDAKNWRPQAAQWLEDTGIWLDETGLDETGPEGGAA